MADIERKVTVWPVRDGQMVFSFAVLSPAGAVELRFAVHMDEHGDQVWNSHGEGVVRARGIEVHSATPLYQSDLEPSDTQCWLIGGKCWHDGTSLWAIEHVLPGLKAGGTDWLWPVLEERHAAQFGPKESDHA